jgi:uncharacterized membrane protein
MSLEQYYTIFMAISLMLILVAAMPTLTMVIHIPKTSQSFSEFWVLGTNRTTDYYPFNITLGEQKSVFLGVRNHLGFSAYYVVYAKFRNQTQPLPDSNRSLSSVMPSLYEFRRFIADGENWEIPLNFTILGTPVPNNNFVVNQISINGVDFNVEYTTTRDLGLLYQMFFELWSYNTTSRELQYDNRFVSIWLKING